MAAHGWLKFYTILQFKVKYNVKRVNAPVYTTRWSLFINRFYCGSLRYTTSEILWKSFP